MATVGTVTNDFVLSVVIRRSTERLLNYRCRETTQTVQFTWTTLHNYCAGNEKRIFSVTSTVLSASFRRESGTKPLPCPVQAVATSIQNFVVVVFATLHSSNVSAVGLVRSVLRLCVVMLPSSFVFGRMSTELADFQQVNTTRHLFSIETSLRWCDGGDLFTWTLGRHDPGRNKNGRRGMLRSNRLFCTSLRHFLYFSFLIQSVCMCACF